MHHAVKVLLRDLLVAGARSLEQTLFGLALLVLLEQGLMELKDLAQPPQARLYG
jgi:hypothetical protein